MMCRAIDRSEAAAKFCTNGYRLQRDRVPASLVGQLRYQALCCAGSRQSFRTEPKRQAESAGVTRKPSTSVLPERGDRELDSALPLAVLSLSEIDVGHDGDHFTMARNPNAQRPRVPGWPRVERITVGISILERDMLRAYAKRNGLAVGAAARELIAAALLIEADANPTASEWNAVLAGARRPGVKDDDY